MDTRIIALPISNMSMIIIIIKIPPSKTFGFHKFGNLMFSMFLFEINPLIKMMLLIQKIIISNFNTKLANCLGYGTSNDHKSLKNYILFWI